MSSEFSRILTLLRKEKGLSQKEVASKLGISQALLSHYEKGIRECGLDFLITVADFYGVSCDYMLGRTPERNGTMLSVEEIPDCDTVAKDNKLKGSIYAVLNKKLITNSINVLFDLLSKTQNEGMIENVSNYLILSVYRMFRLIFNSYDKNQQQMFRIPKQVSNAYCISAMEKAFAKADSIAEAKPVDDLEKIENPDELSISSEKLSQNYPLFASSLLNLVSNAEDIIENK